MGPKKSRDINSYNFMPLEISDLLLCCLWYLSILPLAQSEALPVLQHLRQVEELRDELLHVAGGHVAHHAPRGGEAVEAPVSQVKVPVLEPVIADP